MTINFCFFIIFILAEIACINDYIIYIFGIGYVVSLIIASLLTIILNAILIKRKKILISFDFEKEDIFLFVAMLFVTLLTGIVYPEYTYDSISYHIYLQKYFPIDKVNFDFFPTRIYCLCLFPLGDRIYYIFRFLFGLRFGTIVSFFSPIVLYYQTKTILKKLTNNSNLVPICSYIVFGITTYSRYVGSYYIDNISVLFLIELLIIVLYNKEKVLSDKMYTYIFALISGFAIAIKITSVFYILPIYIYLIIKYRKSIKLDFYLSSIILILLPSTIYLIDNYLQTGSILYPYYNTVFKSKYFGIINWQDERFNINGFFSKIIWPTIIGFKYDKYGDDLYCSDILFGISYVIFILSLSYRLFKKKIDQITKFEILTLIYYIFWILIMQGYHRYGVLVALSVAIISIAESIHIIGNKLDSIDIIIKKAFYIYTLSGILICGVYSMKYYSIQNSNLIFKDRDSEKCTISIDGVWLAPEDICAFVSLVRENDTPIINMHREYFEDSKEALSMWEEKISNNKLFTIIDYYGGDIEDNPTYRKIADDGFVVKEYIKRYSADEIPYINANGEWILVELERNEI